MEDERRVAPEQARGIDPLPEIALEPSRVVVVPEAFHVGLFAPADHHAFTQGAAGIRPVGGTRHPYTSTGVDLRDYYDNHWTHVPEGQVDYTRLRYVLDWLEPGSACSTRAAGPGFSPRCCVTTAST